LLKLDQLRRFLSALAQTAGQMCNNTQLCGQVGGQVGLNGKTASPYVGVFEKMYLLKPIEVWARNCLNCVVKTSKLQFVLGGGIGLRRCRVYGACRYQKRDISGLCRASTLETGVSF
jgi:hypothetical protein